MTNEAVPESWSTWYRTLVALLEACGQKQSYFEKLPGAPSRPTLYKARDGILLTEEVNQQVVAVLNKTCIPSRWKELARESERVAFLNELRSAAPDCIQCKKSSPPEIDAAALFTVFRTQLVPIEVELRASPESAEQIKRELTALMKEFANKHPGSSVHVGRIRKGSLKIELRMSGLDAEAFVQMMADGATRERLKVSSIQVSAPLTTKFLGIPSPTVEVDVASPELDGRLKVIAQTEARAIRVSQIRRMEVIARLLSHFSYSIRYFLFLLPFGWARSSGFNRYLTFLNSTLSEGTIRDHKEELKRLAPHSLVWWPVLTFSICLLMGIPALLSGLVATTLACAFGAVVLATSGSFYCAATISASGSAAAGVPLCVGLFYAHLVACSVFGDFNSVGFAVLTAEPFMRVVGGIPGVTIPEVAARGGSVLALSSICVCAIGIWLAAEVMPGPVESLQGRRCTSRPVLGSYLGFLSGFNAIGLVKGLTVLFGGGELGFLTAFLLIGVPSFGVSLWIRRPSLTGIGVLVCVYVVLTVSIVVTAFKTSGLIGFVFGGMATASFHATFFVLAASVGGFIGGRRAAVNAAAWEGCLGFAGLGVVRLLSANLEERIHLAVLLGVGGCTILSYVFAHRRPGLVLRLGKVLPPAAIAFCLICFLVLPFQGVKLGTLPRGIHQFGAILLGAFLCVSFVLQGIYTVCARRSPAWGRYAIIRWWCLTETLPAVAAILSLLSGLRLLYESGLSLSVGYIFGMFIAFTYFFVDGLAFYRPLVSRIYKASGGSGGDPSVLPRLLWSDQVQLSIHTISFPLVFWLGYSRPAFGNPLSGLVLQLEGLFGGLLGEGMGRVAAAAAILALIAAFMVWVRRPWRHR
jgi:hypothetical protein